MVLKMRSMQEFGCRGSASVEDMDFVGMVDGRR